MSINTKIFLAISGNIGTGKTTLSRLLSNRFGWKPHFEAVKENPYLKDFYRDMQRWSFPLQIFFLNHRFKTHQTIVSGGFSAIQDRSIYEDANIFARGLYEQGKMERRDYLNYLSVYESMSEFLTPPDLIVYLRKRVPKLKTRIAQRGYDYEKSISTDYLELLNNYYDDWMESYSLGKKLILETDELDFLNNSEHFDFLTQKIVNALDQRDLFLNQKISLSL